MLWASYISLLACDPTPLVATFTLYSITAVLTLLRGLHDLDLSYCHLRLDVAVLQWPASLRELRLCGNPALSGSLMLPPLLWLLDIGFSDIRVIFSCHSLDWVSLNASLQ